MFSNRIFASPRLEAAFLEVRASGSRRVICLLHLLFAAMWASLGLRTAEKVDLVSAGRTRRLVLITAVCFMEAAVYAGVVLRNHLRLKFVWSERARARLALMNIVCCMFVVMMVEGDNADMAIAHPVPASLVQLMLVVFSDLRATTCWVLYLQNTIAFAFIEAGVLMHTFSTARALLDTCLYAAGLGVATYANLHMETLARQQFLAQLPVPPRVWAARLHPVGTLPVVPD